MEGLPPLAVHAQEIPTAFAPPQILTPPSGRAPAIGWQGTRGGPLNAVQPNPDAFPDMKPAKHRWRVIGMVFLITSMCGD
jgi:hypothetical protein